MVTSPAPGFRHLLLLGYGIFKSATAGDGLRHRARDARAFELGAAGAEDGLRGTEAIEQLARGPRSQARYEFQSQPVKLVFPDEDGGLHEGALHRTIPFHPSARNKRCSAETQSLETRRVWVQRIASESAGNE